MSAIKLVGSTGQISLGKRYAGRKALVEELEPGVWLVKVGDFVPDDERWLQASVVREALDEALEWSSRNPPQAADLNQLEKRLLDER
jgi:hypothetical protein